MSRLSGARVPFFEKFVILDTLRFIFRYLGHHFGDPGGHPMDTLRPRCPFLLILEWIWDHFILSYICRIGSSLVFGSVRSFQPTHPPAKSLPTLLGFPDSGKNRKLTRKEKVHTFVFLDSGTSQKYAQKQVVHTSRVPRFRKKSKICPKTDSSHFSGSQIPEKLENRIEKG